MTDKPSIQTTNGKRLAKNTLFLYFRMLLIMGVALFTSRITLDALGEEDFGLNNVVAGLIVVFSFINGSLASATSRFITYELGANGESGVRRVFATSIKIHAMMALSVLVLGEIAGVLIVNNFLNIPDGRLFACNVVFQIVILMSMISIIQVPFNSMIISHERMDVYAFIGIVEVIGRCIIAYSIYVTTADKLITLSALQLFFAIGIIIFYVWYCKRRFGSQIDIMGKLDHQLMRQMLGYTSWSILGSTASMLKNQGIVLLINNFFGAAVNAANAVAYQVNSAVMNFTNNFTLAMNPQIVKSYAAGQHAEMHRLVMRGGKMSFFLLTYLCFPLLVEADEVLSLWLKQVPVYSADLMRLVLILTLVESFNYTIVCAIQATGNVRNYQVVVGGLTILNFPVAYVVFYLGGGPQSALIVSIVISAITLFVRLYFLKIQLGISPLTYLRQVIIRSWGVALLCSVAPLLVSAEMQDGFLRLVVVTAVIFAVNTIVIWTIGLDNTERDIILKAIHKFLHRNNSNSKEDVSL